MTVTLGVVPSTSMATLVQLAVQELLGIDVLVAKLDETMGVVTRMSVDLAALDAALASFASDLDTALASIQAKLDSLSTPLDLSSEVGTIQTAQARLDQFVSGLEPAAPAVSDPPPASGVTTGVFDNPPDPLEGAQNPPETSETSPDATGASTEPSGDPPAGT